MTERPILFSGAMVNAIRAGTKTQTRRVMATKWGQPRLVEPAGPGASDRWNVWCEPSEPPPGANWDWIRCPYGIPGDRLWVRETWAKAGEVGDEIEYRADNHDPLGAKWRPSIFMPRWASRLTLEVTHVRVERLQSINGRDVLAEGVDNGKSNPTMGERWENQQRMAFLSLWNNINGKRPDCGWDSNPFVWVVSFKRVDSAAKERVA